MRTREQLLRFLSAAVFGQPAGTPDPEVSWEALYELAKEHGVIPLVYPQLKRYQSKIAKETFSLWKDKTLAIIMNNEKLMQVQDEVIQLLQGNGISCAVLKGSSFSVCYPNPELRPLGDIDLLIDPCHMEKAADLLVSQGFHAPETDHPFHVDYYRDKTILEIHGAVSAFHDPVGGREAEKIMERALLDKKQAEMGAYSFPVMSSVHQVLHALLHMEQHMTTSSIGLRQVYDWAVLINQVPVEEFKNEIIPAVRRCGLERYAKAITKVCITYLHTAENYSVWCEEIDDDLTAQMVGEIFRAGNLKRTKNLNDIGHLMVSRKGSGYFSTMVKALFELTEKNFPAAKKHPILRPFLAIYIAVRYAVRSAFGLRPRVSVSDTLSTAQNRNQLYRELKLYEVEHP